MVTSVTRPARRRLLLVEDDAELRGAVTAALEARGWEVYASSSCAEGEAVARAWRPDAVVVDLHGTGDPAPLARLGLPLLLSSGSDDAYLASAARRLGAAGALPKPYGSADLLAALVRLIPVSPAA